MQESARGAAESARRLPCRRGEILPLYPWPGHAPHEGQGRAADDEEDIDGRDRELSLIVVIFRWSFLVNDCLFSSMIVGSRAGLSLLVNDCLFSCMIVFSYA